MEAINIYTELIKWKPNKQGHVPIAIRFDFNRQRVAIEQIGYRIKISEWNNDDKKVKSSCPQAELLNQLIENRLNKHKNYFLRRQTFNLPISREIIKQYVRAGSSLESFIDYAEHIISTKTLKDGQHYGEDTKRRYRDEIKRLIIYKTEIPFHQFNVNFLNDYKLWLQNEYKKKDGKRLDKNSIWKTFSFLRMIYNQAIKDEIILPEGNPFKQFTVGSCEVNVSKIKYLELSEIELIENVLITRYLNDLTLRVGWRFLAMCVCGMRISDAMNLDDASFNDAGDLEFVPYKTRRHGNKASVPMVSERQRRYMQKTISLPLPKTDAKSFRTTFNIHLKAICAAANIECFTSHSGRHTMGALLVDAGIQDKAAMAMLGVKSDKVIKTYLHLKDSKLKSEAMKLNNIM